MFGRSSPAAAPPLRRAPLRFLGRTADMHVAQLYAGGQVVLEAHDADLLASCSSFETLSAHASRYSQHTGANVDGVQQQLLALESRGLLVPLADIRPSGHLAAAPTISATSILTAHRPKTALRCVRSVLETHDKQAHDLLVCDDSDSASDAQALEDGLLALAAEFDAPIRLLNRTHKRDWLSRIAARESVPASLVEAAVMGLGNQTSRCGANRNAQQLALQGQAFVSIDDDTVCRFHAPPGAAAKPQVSGRIDSTAVWRAETREHIWGAHPAQHCAPASTHAGVTGAAVNHWLPSDTDLNSLGDHALALLSSGRIRASMGGLAGDCGMGGVAYLLWNDGPSLDRMLADKAHYVATRSSRNLLRSTLTPTVTRSPFFMGANTGYDNASLLPPYFPAGRNADGIFGATLTACDPDAWIGHIAVAIAHDPPDDRHTTFEAELDKACTIASNQLLCAMIVRHGNHDGALADNMAALGHQLVAVACNERRFTNTVRELGVALHCHRLRQLGELFDRRDGQPDYWARDIRALQARIHAALGNLDAHLLTDCIDWAQAQSAWRRYGELLIHWPAIREAAQATIAADGQPGIVLR
ncbi:hypothetical protein GYB61_11960 [bacterium]|nr:hypothetical protein [bacterium]